MADYEAFFSNAGVAATGLTLTWSGLKKRSDGDDVTPQPEFTEVGLGWYRFTASPTEVWLGTIDGSATLDDADRYLPVKLTPSDENITTIRTDISDLQTHGDANWETADISTLATGTDISYLQAHGDANWSAADISALEALTRRIRAVATGKAERSGTATNPIFTFYDDDNTTVLATITYAVATGDREDV